MMKNYIITVLKIALLLSLGSTAGRAQTITFDEMKNIFLHPNNYPNFITIGAHRGYWKDGQENSLSAIRAAIALNVSMVELDLKTTKDGVVGLAHDYDFGRLTTCPGRNNCQPGQFLIKNYTFNEIRNIYNIKLKDEFGNVTTEALPTLDEALKEAKGRILVDLDKVDLTINVPKTGITETPFFDKVYAVIDANNMFDQVIVKGRAGGKPNIGAVSAWTPAALRSKFPNIDWKKLLFTPIYFADNGLPGHPDRRATQAEFVASIKSFVDDAGFKVPGVELIYQDEDDKDSLRQAYTYVKTLGKQVIQFAAYPENQYGHWSPLDLTWKDQALGTDHSINWDWLLTKPSHQPTLVITDRLEVLKQYLTLLGKQNPTPK